MSRIVLAAFVLLTWVFGSPARALGQSVSSPTIGVTGGMFKGTTMSLAFTAGEVVVGSFEGETVKLSQGFVNVNESVPITTSVDANPELPAAFTLHQNFPNPFNPSTKIAFDLPRASEVSITVYNYLGMRVGQIVKMVLEAGSHRVTFDGSGLASGTYFYRLQANGAVKAIRKMTLIK
jgi:hypothetical protein